MEALLPLLAGSLALVAEALACLGPTGGARSIWHGFSQIIRGAPAPASVGVPLLRSLLEMIRVEPASTGLGVVAEARDRTAGKAGVPLTSDEYPAYETAVILLPEPLYQVLFHALSAA